MGSIDFEKIKELKNEIIEMKNQTKEVNEEKTKQWFIVPLFELLGYGKFDIEPEASADYTKKGEKVDYKLNVEGKAIAIIECKKLLEPLENHINQLKKYFQAANVHLAILTNGVNYWFFTDSKQENIMHDEPYLKIDLGESNDLHKFDAYTRDSIQNAPIPNVANTRKALEADLSAYKSRIKELESQIKDMEATIKKQTTNKDIGEMQSIVDDLRSKLEKTEERLENANKELEELKENNNLPVLNEEDYNAMIVRQKIEKDNLAKQISSLEKENKTLKRKRETNPYKDTALEKQKIPNNIARDMIYMLPEEVFVPETKILDPFCKYGELLDAFRTRAMSSKALIEAFPDEEDRYEYISDNMLYAIVVDEKGLKEVTRVIHQVSNPKKNHVVMFSSEEEYLESMKANSKIFLNKRLEELGQMTFDIVVGNPPYNSDIYLTFVELGCELATLYSVFITPAKWQSKSGEKNEKFRKNISPYIYKLVYHPDCLDIFAIQESSGICYYLLDKKTHEQCEITNKSSMKPIINSVETRSISHEETLWNCGNTIFTKIKASSNYKPYVLNEIAKNKRKKYTINANKQLNVGTGSSGCWDWERGCIKADWVGKGGVLFTEKGAQILGKVILIRNGIDLSSGTSVDIFTTNNIDEAKSFVSWLFTKFIRFLIMINIGSLTMINKRGFRFIPDPGPFDHIFTDEELYQKYNLTQDEIDIIESVIKERK